jgi:hypothetical protein
MTMAPASVPEFRAGIVFERAFNALFRHFAVFAGISGVANLPLLFYLLWVLANPYRGDEFGTNFDFMMVGSIFLGSLCDAAILHATFQYLRGQPVSAYKSVSIGFRRIFVVLILSVLTMIAVMAGLLLLVIPGLIIATMLLVTIPVAVVEGLGPFESLRRSVALTKGYRLALFGLLVVLGISNFAANKVISLSTPTMIVTFTFLWSTLFTAFHSILVTVAYHDLRSLKEGVDIEQIASVFD